MTKILVIDDEDMLREEIVEWLTLEGYEAIGAADGVEGVNAAVLHQPDLIVCDINMPRLDGYGVLIDVQANSTMRLTPFIFLTARTGLSEIRKGMQLGADDYLTKPFDRLDLLRAIQTRLDRKAEQDHENQQLNELFREMLTRERTQRLLQAKLVTLFSHDFRDSLGTIQLANNLLRDFVQDEDTSRSVEYLARIEVYIGQLIQMLDDMVLLAQMETGKFVIKPIPVNVDPFLQHIVKEFRILHGTTHKIVLESRFTGAVIADMRLLRQIATHLIANAIQYSHPGSVVRITLSSYEDRCILIVKDQGIGIPEADQPNLFDVFLCGSDVSNGSDAKLGLVIVKRAVDLHGGTITFESQIGIGTTFIVTLPLYQTQETNP
jgi:two-component system, sensor histidine kinase and response regulator